MILNRNFTINENGSLSIESVDALNLTKRYSTPLYVLSRNEIIDNIQMIKKQLEASFTSTDVAYASKALSCKEVYRIMRDEGISIDVASIGEIATAMSVGFPSEKIYFHGNSKTVTDIQYAIECKIMYIVIDNLNEIDIVNGLALQNNIVQKVLLRLSPGVEAHTHHHIMTGSIDSKFGLPIEREELYRILDKISTCKGLKLYGLHCHIGSQIVDYEPYQQTAKIMISVFRDINKRYDFDLEELNLGGGFGIPYLENQQIPTKADFIVEIAKTIKEECTKLSIDIPKIVFEPGRSIVGSAGITLYTIGSIKEIKGIRRYISVDGSIADNIRYALYQSDYVFDIVKNVTDDKSIKVSVAGRSCETGDMLGEDVYIQEHEVGDVLSVYPTGAYNYSMASNYNRLTRPAMVMVDKDKAYEIIKRETIEDILSLDI